jgi:hypothetical protein
MKAKENTLMIRKIITFLVTMVLATGVAYAAPAALPKTGQITSHGTGAVDDGALQRGAAWPNPRFTVTYCDGTGPCADQGADCDGNATTDAVTDNLTGLMWTRTTDFNEIDWQQALDYAGGLTLCGFNDWRLPNVNELESLVNVEQIDLVAWLNAQGFGNVAGGIYWSSTANVVDPSLKWTLMLRGGIEGTEYAFPRFNTELTWPVRSRL